MVHSVAPMRQPSSGAAGCFAALVVDLVLEQILEGAGVPGLSRRLLRLGDLAPLLVDPDDVVALRDVLVGDVRHDLLALAHERVDEQADAQHEQYRDDGDDGDGHAGLPSDTLCALA